MGILISKVFASLFGSKEVRILILGLDNAGKTTILYRLQSEEIEQSVPTIGFNMETLQYKNIKFQVWDLGGQTSIRPYWRCYYPNTDAVIYVVDSADTDRLNIAKQELHALLEEEELKDSILLLFANKQDQKGALNAAQISEAMGLTDIRNRQWSIKETTATVGSGLFDGFDWIVTCIKVLSKMTLPADNNATNCPVFYPSQEQFTSFSSYVRQEIEPKCSDIGICKIVPPKGWFIRDYDDIDFVVENPVSQHVAGKKGVFNIDLVEKKSLTAQEFKEIAAQCSNGEPHDLSKMDEIERAFWKSMRSTMDAPVYGADIEGSLFDSSCKSTWNLNDLKTILCRIELPGVTRSMLYFGMWRAMFAFHTEDMDLYSINYLHHGKPKFWYCIPPRAASSFERAAQAMYPEEYHSCHQFLRHKNSMISPNQLKAFGIPFYKTLQSEGEFVITFPAAYHSGFNLGFNIAEAVNFATLRWVPFGLRARVCKCSPESVRIDMDDFLISLFSSGKAKSDDIPEDAWVFSCQCKMYSSSEDPSFCVDREWFECPRCKIWCHVHCIHPQQASKESTKLPDSILCHRCQSGDYNVPSIGSKRKRVQKRKRREKKLPKQKNTRKSNALCGSKSLMKLSKGIDVFLDGYEARVTAVDGKYARIHYKGYSADYDEWLPRTGQELAKRNLTSL